MGNTAAVKVAPGSPNHSKSKESRKNENILLSNEHSFVVNPDTKLSVSKVFKVVPPRRNSTCWDMLSFSRVCKYETAVKNPTIPKGLEILDCNWLSSSVLLSQRPSSKMIRECGLLAKLLVENSKPDPRYYFDHLSSDSRRACRLWAKARSNIWTKLLAGRCHKE